MLIPLGGMDYGFKGAALAGLATLLTAVLQGTTLDTEFIPMIGATDMSTPRNMGHFFLAVSPDHFGGRESFNRVMAHYLQLLRGSPAREGGKVMAPGDREWAVIRERQEKGIPVDLDSARFLGLE
jgi:LDH2 family malate/lactate/ureidoglycolate dehydrogenase